MQKRKNSLLFVFLTITLLMSNTRLNLQKIEADSAVYHVKRIENNGKLTTVGNKYSSFNIAKDTMNKQSGSDFVVTSNLSKSPSKIVAMKSGYVQSYPYRKGSGFGEVEAKTTLNIYKESNAKTTKTYIPAHYKLFYHETLEVNNKLVVKASIQGATGYIDIYKTDLIPMKFVNDNISILLGGNEDYYKNSSFYGGKPEPSDFLKVEHDYYSVSNNEVTANYSRTYNKKHGQLNNHPKYSTRYAEAPSWLKNGQKYYSKDGIEFYTDPELKKPVKDGSKPGKFYAYYQWLPIRSMSNFTGDDFNAHLKNSNKLDSIMIDNEQAFIESGNKYGMNSLLLYAQAVHESAYGTSGIAKNKYNLFGWNAVDSNPGLATKYDGVFSAVENQMAIQLSGYFDDGDWRNEGMAFGNKGSGVTVRYASDPFYGIKIAAIAYQIDEKLGFIDRNMYDLVLLDNRDNQGINIRKSPNDSSSLWGTTKGSIITDIRTNLGSESGFVKTNLPMVVKQDKMVKEVGEVDLTKEFGYLSESVLTKLPKTSAAKNKIPTQRVIVSDVKENFETLDNLKLRSSWTTNSRVFATIPKGKYLEGYKTNNGWVKVTYNNQVGYVHSDYINAPDTPNIPDSPEYKLGDVDGDGEIDGFDMMMIRDHYLEIKKLSGKQLLAADVDGDGEVDGFDMMMIRDHYLEIKLINE